METGKILAKAGDRINADKAKEIQNSGINEVLIVLEDGKIAKIVGNNFVDASAFLNFDLAEVGIYEKVHYPTLKEILDQNLDEKSLKQKLKEDIDKLIPRHIIIDDIIASINYIINLPNGIGDIDDIDHLGNRRLRYKELLQNQFKLGYPEWKSCKERMTIQDVDTITPQALINIRPIVAAQEFSKQLIVPIHGSNKS